MPKSLFAAVLFTLLATSPRAFAGDAALAEALFRQGRELMEKGDYAGACPKLAESFHQDESTGTLLALALCQEQVGQTASAWASFTKVVTRAKQDGRPDRERAAREHAQALETKLSYLTIEVDPAAAAQPGVTLTRDGLPLGHGAWGASSPIDPGEHVVEVTAPGKLTWRASIFVGATADSHTLRVPALVDDAQRAPGAFAVVAPRRADRAPAPAKGNATLRTLALGSGAAGVVTLGVGGYFALHASSLNGDSKREGCGADNRCEAAGYAKRKSAISAASTATITSLAGGVLTAVGVTLFLVDNAKRRSDANPRLEATAAAGPAFSGVLVRGRFF